MTVALVVLTGDARLEFLRNENGARGPVGYQPTSYNRGAFTNTYSWKIKYHTLCFIEVEMTIV